jgi:hypothetical protein
MHVAFPALQMLSSVLSYTYIHVIMLRSFPARCGTVRHGAARSVSVRDSRGEYLSDSDVSERAAPDRNGSNTCSMNEPQSCLYISKCNFLVRYVSERAYTLLAGEPEGRDH